MSVTGSLGEAYLVPYADQFTFQIGYRGLIKLARNATAGLLVATSVFPVATAFNAFEVMRLFPFGTC